MMVVNSYIWIIFLTAAVIVNSVTLNEHESDKWSDWLPWEGCSSPCSAPCSLPHDIGIQKRRRTYSNALDDVVCSGESVDYRTCKIKPCKVHGDWSTWSSWGGCSVSCDIGLERRKRRCLDQQINDNNVFCRGESIDYKICTKGACADVSNRNANVSCKAYDCPSHSIAFTATNVVGSSGDALTFFRVPVNLGNNFSGSTGRFTCKIPGLYSFSVTLSRNKARSGNVHAYLRAPSASLTLFSQIAGQYSMSASGTFHLNKNDVVYVDGNPAYFNGGTYSYFSGFLIKADN